MTQNTAQKRPLYLPNIPADPLQALAAGLIACNSLCYLAATALKESEGISVTEHAFYGLADGTMGKTITKLRNAKYNVRSFERILKHRNLLAHHVQFDGGLHIIFYPTNKKSGKNSVKKPKKYNTDELIAICFEVRSLCIAEMDKLLKFKEKLAARKRNGVKYG